VVGRLVFEHAVFRHAEISEQRLILYTPTSDYDTPAKLERLLELEADLEPLALSG
jgi:hypothetical protein